MLSLWCILLDLPAEFPGGLDIGKRKRACKDDLLAFLNNWEIGVTTNQNGNALGGEISVGWDVGIRSSVWTCFVLDF